MKIRYNRISDTRIERITIYLRKGSGMDEIMLRRRWGVKPSGAHWSVIFEKGQVVSRGGFAFFGNTPAQALQDADDHYKQYIDGKVKCAKCGGFGSVDLSREPCSTAMIDCSSCNGEGYLVHKILRVD